MRILHRYIFRAITKNLLLVASAGVLFIYLITIFVEFQYGFQLSLGGFLTYVFAKFILVFPLIQPIILFLAGLMAIYQLNASSELTMIVLNGITPFKLAMIVSSLLVLVAAILGVSTESRLGYFDRLSSSLRGERLQVSSVNWINDSDQLIFLKGYRSTEDGNAKVELISITNLKGKLVKGKARFSITNIKNALYLSSTQEWVWEKKDTAKYHLVDGIVKHVKSDETIDINISPRVLYLASVEHKLMDARELYDYYKYKQSTGKYNSKQEVLFKGIFTKYIVMFLIFLLVSSHMFAHARMVDLRKNLLVALTTAVVLYYAYYYIEIVNQNLGYDWWANPLYMSILLVGVNYLVWKKKMEGK